LDWIEITGYVASLFVAAALSMSSIARLRVLNLLGAFAFTIYGWKVGAIPVMAVNAYIVVINIVFLQKMQPGRSEAFELLRINRQDNRYLQRFLHFHKSDIRKFFPEFEADKLDGAHIVLILRDMLPVGLVVCSPTDDKTLTINLDYVIPSHRDFRCAQYFYQAWSDVISTRNISRFVIRDGVGAHESYLKKMGFQTDKSLGPGWLSRPAVPSS